MKRFLPIVALAIAVLLFGPAMVLSNETIDYASTAVVGDNVSVENSAEHPGLDQEVQCVRGCTAATCAAVQKDAKQTIKQSAQKAAPKPKARLLKFTGRLAAAPFRLLCRR